MAAIRALPKDLQEVAIRELNEDPKRIEKDLAYIKEWLSKQPHLKVRTDDQFLVAFLRGTKFSLERTKEKLDMYHTFKTITPEIYQSRDPFAPEIQKILSLGINLPLPKLVQPDGPRYVLNRNNLIEKNNLGQIDLVKVGTMMQDILMLEDDNVEVAGIMIVQDMSDISVGYVKSLPLSLMKKTSTIYQHGYPFRIKGIHMFNISKLFDVMYSICKPFMTEKLRRRIQVYTTLEDMYSTVPKEILPEEYGGQGGKVEDIVAYWKKKMESYRDWFLEDKIYGTDEKLRPGKPKTSESVFGLEGSFRQLSVD